MLISWIKNSLYSENHHVENGQEEEEDEFAGILEETNTSPRDEQAANLPAVNYKVSMEEYEKVCTNIWTEMYKHNLC